MKKFKSVLFRIFICAAVLINHSVQTSTIRPVQQESAQISWWQKTAIGATILVALANIYAMYKKAFRQDVESETGQDIESEQGVEIEPTIIIRRLENQRFNRFFNINQKNYGNQITFNLYKKSDIENENNPIKRIIYFDYSDKTDNVRSVLDLISGRYRHSGSVLEYFYPAQRSSFQFGQLSLSKNEFKDLLKNLAEKMEYVKSLDTLNDFINRKDVSKIEVSIIFINRNTITTNKNKDELLEFIENIKSDENQIVDEQSKDAVTKKLNLLYFKN